jgi:hypothetical protein
MADPTDSDTDDSGSVKSGISVSSLRSSILNDFFAMAQQLIYIADRSKDIEVH